MSVSYSRNAASCWLLVLACLFALSSSLLVPATAVAAVRQSRALTASDRSISARAVPRTSSPLVRSVRSATALEATKDRTLTSDEDSALIDRISAEVFAESGVELDQLINPSKVVNLERDLLLLKERLAIAPNAEKGEIESTIEKKEKTLFIEKRAVMRSWLKNLFVGQSVLATAASLLMVYNAVPGQDLPLAVQVLGFWMWWLFIIPSLR